MQTKLTNRPVEQVIAAIQALDLDPIKLKLMDPAEGHGWSREYADSMEVGYKRFLTLSVTHAEETLAPSKDVDRFWHGHILDTLKYAEDCERIFGHFLHHFPYFGMRGAEDAANLAKAAENTRRLYRQEFGSMQGHDASESRKVEDAAYCGANRAESAAYCGALNAESVAYCGAIATEKPAYCGAAGVENRAYCGALSAESVAYCGAIKAEKTAYCGANRTESVAYCGAASSDKLKVSVRPGLPAVA